MLYRVSSALITDYSSGFIDYMLTGKPMISFAHDLERYIEVERGAFYDLRKVFPGAVCESFEELEIALSDLFRSLSPIEREEMSWKRSMFFDFQDDRSSRRVLEKVEQIMTVDSVGNFDFGRNVT